jgi:hypothetical protein
LERGEGFLDIFLKVLNENGRFSFQQEVESILGSIDFQKSIDDENNKKDPRKDPEIDHGETSFYLIRILDQNNPVLIFLWVTPVEERSFWDARVPWARFRASFVENRGTLVQGTISATVLE